MEKCAMACDVKRLLAAVNKERSN